MNSFIICLIIILILGLLLSFTIYKFFTSKTEFGHLFFLVLSYIITLFISIGVIYILIKYVITPLILQII